MSELAHTTPSDAPAVANTADVFSAWGEMVEQLSKAYVSVASTVQLTDEQKAGLHNALADAARFARDAKGFSNPEKIIEAFMAEGQQNGAENAANYFAGITKGIQREKEEGRLAALFEHVVKAAPQGTAFDAQDWLQNLTMHGDDLGFREGLKPADALPEKTAKDALIDFSARAVRAWQVIFSNAPEMLPVFQHGVTIEQLPQAMQQKLNQAIEAREAEGRMDELSPAHLEKLQTAITGWEALAQQSPEQQREWINTIGLCYVPNATKVVECLMQHILVPDFIPEAHTRQMFGERLSRWMAQHSEAGKTIVPEVLASATFDAFGKNNGERLEKLQALEALHGKAAHNVLDAVGIQPKGRELSDAHLLVTDAAATLAELAAQAQEAANARVHRIAALDPTAVKETPQPEPLHPEAPVVLPAAEVMPLPSASVATESHGAAITAPEIAPPAETPVEGIAAQQPTPITAPLAPTPVETLERNALPSSDLAGGAQASAEDTSFAAKFQPKAPIQPTSLNPEDVKASVGTGVGLAV